jgi:hypothetical protein
LKIKGIVHIQITDNTGEIKLDHIQENLIPDNTWVAVLGSDATKVFYNKAISISTDTSTPTASVSTIANVIGTCYKPSGITSPLWVETVDPPYGTITGRIDPQGTSRTFTAVALTALSQGGTQSISSTTAYARLLLDIPCTQGINDYVNITYTIQFLDNVGNGFINKKLNRYDFGRAQFNIGNYIISDLRATFCSINPSAIALPPAQGTPDPITYSSTSQASSHFKYKYTATPAKTNYLGIIFNGITQGRSNDSQQCYAANKYKGYATKEPIQTGFKHSSASNIPFFDAGNIANSQGLILFGGSWTNKIPEFYRVFFTSTGATGAAQYYFQMLKHVGFNGNTFTCADARTLYRSFGLEYDSSVTVTLYSSNGIQYATGLHGWQNENFDIHRLSSTEIVQYDSTGVSVVDIFDGTYTNFDATTTPALTALQIRQIAVDSTNRIIYVACRLTGLWIINLTANTITQQFNSACYAVDVGRNNVAIAIIEGSLRTSNDWIIVQSFTYAGITDGNWSRIKYLKADPEHVNDRIAIVAYDGTSANKIVWYQFSDHTTANGIGNAPSYPSSVDVSDAGSIWVYTDNGSSALQIFYGNASTGTRTSSPSKSLNHSIYGNGNYTKISFYLNNYIGASQFNYGSISYGYTNLNISTDTGALYALHLDSGIILTRTFIRQIFSGNTSLLWTNYGWNGSAWVAGSTTPKTTHTDNQALINGLTIRFQDGTTAPHFISGEHFTQGVNYGQLKDNATDMQLSRAWYSKAVHLDTIPSTTITSPLSLPATTNPYFRMVDVDTPQIHTFLINGTPVTKIWTNSTSPAISEINLQSTGIITFNAGDIGKTLTGSYLWIEV